MKQNNLIAYAAHFVSFVLGHDISQKVNRIILFGSVARGIFDEESDIDIFVDTIEDIEKEIKSLLTLFQHSEMQRKWELKGVNNNISVKVGDINKWKIKRDIISNGILLYGKFKETPENVEYYLLITPSFKKMKKSIKVKMWRKLYGYKQKVGKKTYKTKGILEKLDGRRISNGMIIKMTGKKELIDFLNREKIHYKVVEVWSDSLD